MPLRCAKSLGHLLAVGDVCLLSPKAGTSFPPLSAALQEEQGLLFIFPLPFLPPSQPLALASAPCGRRCPITIVSAPAMQAQSCHQTLKTEIWIILHVGASWRGVHTRTPERVQRYQTKTAPRSEE